MSHLAKSHAFPRKVSAYIYIYIYIYILKLDGKTTKADDDPQF